MKKKRKIWKSLLIGMLLLIVSTTVALLIYTNPKSDNVFEEIYYDRARNDRKMHSNVRTFYIDAHVYRFTTKLSRIFSPWTATRSNGDKICYTQYLYTRLEEDEAIGIIYHKQKNRIEFYRYWTSEESAFIIKKLCLYSYDLTTKELSYGSNRPGERDSFLFDIILKDWFRYNEDKSGFSLEDLGEYEDVGNMTEDQWKDGYFGYGWSWFDYGDDYSSGKLYLPE